MTIDKVFVDMGKCLLVVATSITGLAETLGTYYLHPDGVTQWVTNCTYWKLGSESGASATGPVDPNYDYVYNGTKRMKGPLASSGYAAYTFNGHSLILDCNNVRAGFLLQNDNDQTITFANEGLIFHRDACLASWNESNADIYGKITVNSGARMGIYESGSKGKAFTFHDKFYGSGTVHVYSQLDAPSAANKSNKFTANFSEGVLSEFTGTIKASWGHLYTSSSYTSDAQGIIGLNGGNFPGMVEVAVGGVLRSAGTNTIGGLTLKAGSTLDFTEQPTSESEPVLSVSNALTIEDAVDVNLPAVEETFEQILAAIDESASGRYAMRTRRGILLRAPVGTTLDSGKFVFDADVLGDPTVPKILEIDGRDIKYGDLRYYVSGSGFSDHKNGAGNVDDDMTNVVKWSDGQAPDDPDTGYIINGKFLRNPDRYSEGSEAYRDIFAGGALITSGTNTLIEQDSGFVCNDLRIISGSLLVRDINANGWVDKFWSNDFASYADNGSVRTVNCSKAVSFEGNYGIASGSTLTLSQYALTNPAWDMRANLYGSGTIQTAMGSQTKSIAYKYGSSVFRFSGDNSKFYGKIRVSSSVYNADCRTHAYFTRKEAFGGGRASMTVNGLHFDCNTVLHIPSNSVITVDQVNLGFYLTGNAEAKPQGNRGFVEFDIGTNSVFALEEQLTFNNALRKTGPGTFALGGALKFQTAKGTYSDTPVAGVTDGTNLLTIAEGVFRPLSSTAVDGLEVRFEDGAGLEIEATDDVADGIGRYGMVNSWSTPFVLPEGGITVTVTDPGDKLKKLPKALRKVAIATLSMDKAPALRGKMTGVMVSEFPYAGATIEESDNGDGTVTFYAVPQGPGLVLVIQ
ncbi:MAG: hypothetical protein E7046_12395 [Lentisphaerae bacterium]|nr:hypothetical protein [Lentisphaerota bacterium]